MVGEGPVLFRIEHFEKSGSGVALVVVGQLVYLVKKNQRIHAARSHDRIHNPSGHGAEIGLAVSPDFRFVTHAAERHAHVFSPHRLGNGMGNGGLADPGRSFQTYYLSLDIRNQRTHGDQFQYALLDLIHTVMVAFENRLRVLYAEIVLRPHAPRNRQTYVEISPYDRRLLRTVGQLGQLAGLSAQHALYLVVRVDFVDTLVVIFRVALGCAAVAQFL